jgi:hypothetical protein
MKEKTKYQRLLEVMEKIDKSFKPKLNENEEKFSTIEKNKRGMTFLFAYPDENGIETREGLFNWESKDAPNRELQFVSNREEAEEDLKSMNEDYNERIEFRKKIEDGDVWLEYYPPSESQEYTDGETWYNRSGQTLREPDEYRDDTEGYTPFGDE